MWLFYMDESGNTGARLDDPDQPIHYLVALGVQENKINPLEAAIREVVSSFLPNAWSDKSFEIKGQALRKGAGFFKKLAPDRRILLAQRLLTLLEIFEVKIFYTGIDKTNSEVKAHPHRQAFIFTVLKLDAWLLQNNLLGLLVADEQHEIEQRLIDDVLWGKSQPLEDAGQSKAISSIVDSVHFVRSSNNILVQLADLAVFTINHGLKTLNPIKPAHQADMSLYQLVAKCVVEGGITK